MTPRTRDTLNTRRRLENLRCLIDAFGARQMEAADICDLLKFSPSGARKYVRELREDRIIEVARHIDSTATYLGKVIYKLTLDEAKIAALLAEIDQPSRAPTRKQYKPVKPAPPSVPGRSVHIIGDDTHYAVRLARIVPARDPLFEALFGPALASGGQP
ncbi:ArsR family transcriptional regulator [Rugamonas sp.]|uniref:ArsR family transcriptional regulator n=1 Tax=Rugamonas sp. TaxID=1926287 RepID=UPI0025D8F095|nr:ArsR family transcriptional regulator [Rugamonas sp.]